MKYTTKIKLYSSYFDANDNVSLKSVLNIFQDVASHHGEQIGVGYQEMLSKNLYWVISRIKFDIIKMPLPNQEVIVETWPHEKGRVDFDRDMKITSENGETLIIGTSKWCVISTTTRTLERTDNVIYTGNCINEFNYQDKFTKINFPNLPFENKFNYIVKFSDLDHNKHMNNTNYANLIANAINKKVVKHFEINFLNECSFNDEIIVSSLNTENGEYTQGTINNKQAFIAYTK